MLLQESEGRLGAIPARHWMLRQEDRGEVLPARRIRSDHLNGVSMRGKQVRDLVSAGRE